MSTNISSLEIIAAEKSAATDNIMKSKNNELINGNTYEIFNNEGDDFNDMNESYSNSEYDNNYEYNFNDDYKEESKDKKPEKRQSQ
ncbi:hypothetical protein C1645_813716 [Glomus cerebriforme]|uniref:Uncharacterized protein n=1 Tax=Glomus cerebriforme TaxID=658196 RepID=A0A397TL74_9GLOM|nr:hypothetical protein C1645_813716 [Glomus cerebriforme]